MGKLSGTSPEMSKKRLKMMLWGPSGCGKTVAAGQFPKAYFIDTERGCDQYYDLLNSRGSVLLQTDDPKKVREELRLLLTEKHDYSTLVIDPITHLYNRTQEFWQGKFDQYSKKDSRSELWDYGFRYWDRVKRDFKALERDMLKLDMNIVITAHEKNEYAPGPTPQKIGETFDSMRGDDYLFDIVIRLKQNKEKRFAEVLKERADIGKARLPETFDFTTENLQKYFGDILVKPSQPIALASPKQVEEIENILQLIKLSDETIATWFRKANVESWEEMSEDIAEKCLERLRELSSAT